MMDKVIMIVLFSLLLEALFISGINAILDKALGDLKIIVSIFLVFFVIGWFISKQILLGGIIGLVGTAAAKVIFGL